MESTTTPPKAGGLLVSIVTEVDVLVKTHSEPIRQAFTEFAIINLDGQRIFAHIGYSPYTGVQGSLTACNIRVTYWSKLCRKITGFVTAVALTVEIRERNAAYTVPHFFFYRAVQSTSCTGDAPMLYSYIHSRLLVTLRVNRYCTS
jgi:hypothetical protein